MTGAGPALVDIHATQVMQNRARGIARYVHDLALELCDVAPELVGGLLLDPELALPADLPRLAGTGKLQPSDTARWEAAALLHLTSPYELGVPLHRLLPDDALRHNVKLVVTLYDLIPEVMPDHYFTDPGMRLRYRSRHQLVRSADAVLTLSEASKADAVARLGLQPERVVVVGAGVDAGFVPPSSRAEAAAAAAGAVAGLRPPFVLYTGGADRRKNVDRLLEAWAQLPRSLQHTHQLVVVGTGEGPERDAMAAGATRLGITGRVLLPGLLSDRALLALYQGTELFVYPSLYEGYGLPVAEAMACGAPVVAADASCLPEIVAADALFDPLDPAAISRTVARALTDESYRAALLARSGRAPHTWAGIARMTADAYRALLPEHPRPAPRPVAAAPAPPAAHAGGGRLRLALVAPLPPQEGDVARDCRALLGALAGQADVHLFVDGPPDDPAAQKADVPAGVDSHPVASLGRVEALSGPFDAVVYCLANSDRHAGALACLRARPGTVLAWDVRLTELYAAAPRQRAGVLPHSFGATLHAMYPNRLPPALGAGGSVTAEEAEWWGLLMSRDVITAADRYLATSPQAAVLAHLDARPADRHKVGCLPAGTDPASWAAMATELLAALRPA